jgi:hypothetical protein
VCFDPLTGLTAHNLSACPYPRTGFPTSYVMVFFMFNDLRWEVNVWFIDFSGIDNHKRKSTKGQTTIYKTYI